jgi:hypothetical protein
MLTRRKPATSGTIQVLAEHDIGRGLWIYVAAEVEYTITANRPAVINADPNDCHPEELGEWTLKSISLGNIQCVWYGPGKYDCEVHNLSVTEQDERNAWKRMVEDETDLEQLCRDDAAKQEG